MTEVEQSSSGSPLRTDRGVTNISDSVVSTIAGRSAQEVEGVHMGGGASRSAGGILGNITGSDGGDTRGVSVEVGTTETAIDLKMGIEYGKNILGTVGEVRQKITERIQNMTGLKVTELNVTISDIVFPENGEKTSSRTQSRSGPDFDTRSSSRRGLEAGDGETEAPQQERPSQIREREATPVEPQSRTHTEGESGPVPEEEVRAEGSPVDEDETRRLRFEDDRVEETSSSTTGEEGAETEAESTGSESESAEEDRTQEIDRQRVAEAEERMARRRRRERREDG